MIEYRTGDQWGWQLGAAEMIEPDGPTRVRFRLRRGIMFTGGFGEVTADDVKFSYERIADPGQASEYRDDFAALDHAEVLDRYSGVIVLKEPFAPLWTSTLPSASGCIVSRKAVMQAGGRFTTAPPATAGPYLIREWQPKQGLVLARNPDWSGTPAEFEKIRILPIEDEKAAEIAFAAGELDYTAISVSSIPSYRTAPPAGVRLVEKPSLDYVWLGMNTAAPPFDDLRVRRAVQRAVDVDQVLEAAYFGVAARATGIIAPGLPGHRDKLLGDPHPDPEAAKALLAQAGLASGFACTLDIEAKTERLLAAQVIQANLAAVGIALQINQHDSGTFWSLGSEADGDQWRSLQLILQKYGMQPDPSFATAWFTPEQVGIWNWERFSNAEFGALHKAALTETDSGRTRPHVPPHAGPDGALRRLCFPNSRGQRRGLPGFPHAGAPARRDPGPARVPPGLTARTLFLSSEKDWSGRRDSNPRPQPWQGCALPLSYARADRLRDPHPPANLIRPRTSPPSRYIEEAPGLGKRHGRPRARGSP